MRLLLAGWGRPAPLAPLTRRPALGARPGRRFGLLVLLLLLALAGGARAQAPVALAGANRDICSGLVTTLGDNNPIPGLTYRWSPATGLSSATVHNPRVTLTNVTPGPVVHTFRLTVTDPTGATATDSVQVRVLPLPFVNAGADQTICSGQTITVGSPALPGCTYVWTLDPFLSNPNVAQPTYTPVNPSPVPFFRDLVVIVRGPNGCDATARVRITVNPAVVAAAGPNRSLCAGLTTTLGATPTVPGYTYTWRPATGLSNPAVAQPVLTAANPGPTPVATTYTLTVNGNGCLDSSRVAVTVYPAVVADAGAPVAVCAGQPATLAAGVAPVAGTTYRWSPATGLSNPNVLSPTLTLATAGTFAYTLTAATAPATGTTCSASATVAVTVDSLPAARAGGPVVLCAGETGRLGGAAAVPGVTYRWRPATGLATPTAATTAVTLPNATPVPLTATYTLVATTAAGCADSSQVTVTVNPLAVVEAGPAAATCPGAPLTLGGPAQPGYAYRWSPATGLSDPAVAQPVLTAANATGAPQRLTYYLTATPPGGCPARDSVVVTLNPTPAVPTIAGLAVVCDLGPAQTYAVPATAGATYQWTVTGGSVTAGQGTAQVTVQFGPGAGPYAVAVASTAATGCPGPVARQDVAFDQPTVELLTASVAPASNAQITLSFAAAGSGPVQVLRRVAGQGSFAPVGTVPVAGNAFTDTGVDAAATSYEYRLELANGCGQTVSSAPAQTIRLVATNASTAGSGATPGSTTLSWNAYGGFAVQEYRLYRSLDGGAPALVASLPGTTRQATVPSGAAGASAGGGFEQLFRVVAVGVDPTPRQADSNTATVRFANAIQAYNVITPNHDGRNDALEIDNLGFYPGSSLRIFNRWGREVFQATDYQNSWGPEADVAAGVYYYLLQLPTGTTTRGWVEVVK